MQLGKCKAERVGAVQDVGAVLVVIGVRDQAADFVQLRRPGKLALVAREFRSTVTLAQLAQERTGDAARPQPVDKPARMRGEIPAGLGKPVDAGRARGAESGA